VQEVVDVQQLAMEQVQVADVMVEEMVGHLIRQEEMDLQIQVVAVVVEIAVLEELVVLEL
jgi:hypothetical protein